MDSIKKKMQSLASETANATARAEKWEREVNSINNTADAFEEQVKNLQKKIQQTESAFDVCTEDLFNQTIKLEEMEKKANNAEGQVGDLARRLLLMEEQAIRSEERLAISVTNLANTSMQADKSLADQNDVMNVCSKKSENNDDLEKQLKDAVFTKDESENKYENLSFVHFRVYILTKLISETNRILRGLIVNSLVYDSLSLRVCDRIPNRRTN